MRETIIGCVFPLAYLSLNSSHDSRPVCLSIAMVLMETEKHFEKYRSLT